ncbi:hypothetical protein M413DRAFT_159868 [Hebeloma cylindrosporum]|uniref:Uncharacterized protein n=1 Tax=Hebeloma cylindrosporum TaxID=76867 RepID=A0A0C3CC18_HEBCY|nr:hypothetical protein M413DRAFT_159868 [Hebeloma cylindrosporum h7]
MDVASTIYALAVAVYKLSVGIVNFVGQHQEKGPLITNISDIANQIQSIISPLLLPNHVTYDSVKQVLQALQKALARTDKHLRAWEERPSLRFVAFVNPSAVTSQLREDREQLVHQCLLLLVAMQVGDHMRQYRLLLPTAEDDTSTLPEYSEVALSRRASSSSSKIHDPKSQSVLKPTLPLLIWIDDDPEGNVRNAAYASKRGVTVVRLGSTLATKTWIRVNKDYLKKNDDPRNLRFISDQVRHEVNAEGVLHKNLKAGNEITKFIRDEGFKAPILICTSKQGIALTGYVRSYPNTGSLKGSDYKILNEYLEALGARRRDDTGWMKFGG